jgi:hypothetical protein
MSRGSTVGYGRICTRGHVVEGDDARWDGRHWRCKQCDQVRKDQKRAGTWVPKFERARWEHFTATPWSGQVVCPTCGSADWTLPYNGRSEPGRWRCVWPCHAWIDVSELLS